MQYYSTGSRNTSVALPEAVMRSVAPDQSVYMPYSIPVIPKALFKNIAEMSLTDIGYVVCSVLFGSDIPGPEINEIVKQTLSFPIPMVEVGRGKYALELFHGPTGSFKDIGARFMARVVDYYLRHGDSNYGKINVLVATSGDTGSAVAHGFAGIENVNVFILHPNDRHLRVPPLEFLAPARNIIPITIRGTFEDCQNLVKQAYTDKALNRKINLTSANSINIARLLPQTIYFFHAYARLIEQGHEGKNVCMATPCGNLGNLTAALFAKQMGLPVERIAAAGRGGERLWGSISNGVLSVNDFNRRSLSTNLARINRLIDANPRLADIIECYTFDGQQTDSTIIKTYAEHGYLMDRNTAMACRALDENMRSGETGVFLATAHPAKYAAHLNELIGSEAVITKPFSPRSDKPFPAQHGNSIAPRFDALRDFLLTKHV